MRIRHILFCGLALLSVSAQADAASLYAATAAGAAGRLYLLDQTNGSVIQDIGALNDVAGLNYPITGLAFHPLSGALYGSTGNNPPETGARLVRIDPATAAVTVIGPYNAGPVNASGNPATMADLSFDSAGQLYGVGSIGGPQIYSIDISTGQATAVGNTGITSTTGGGLAIGPSGTFYGTPSASRFGTYDAAGNYTNIANPIKPAGGGYGALAFDGNVLYGLNVGSGSPPPTHLVTIDRTTGAVTDIATSVNSLDAIAFQPRTIPEPGTLAIVFGAAGVWLLGIGRRRSP